jgi:hypothetical protein
MYEPEHMLCHACRGDGATATGPCLWCRGTGERKLGEYPSLAEIARILKFDSKALKLAEKEMEKWKK